VDQIGTYVIYVIMFCAVLGALAAIRNDQDGLGKEFLEGLHSIGPIFVPVAGIMASAPYLSAFVREYVGPLMQAVGADPAIAATSVIANDMGGYQLAHALATSPNGWVVATVIGFMAGPTIVFSIPVGLAMLERKDHRYMALGVMYGLLSIPVGVFLSCLAILVFQPPMRAEIGITGATQPILLDMPTVLANLAPLAVFCILLAMLLRLAPRIVVAAFLLFGRMMYAAITIVLVLSVVQYFTGLPEKIFGGWGFDPIIADSADQFRALEIAGYIGIMLAGAFPMVYLIKRYLSAPMEAIGGRIGLGAAGAAGLIAGAANILALYRLIASMKPMDKVLCIAFAVCAAFSFGDHLAFAANFQPALIPFILLGKLGGGATGFLLAKTLAGPAVKQLSSSESDEQPSVRAEGDVATQQAA
jgi:ethanolamine transporter